MNFEDYIDAPLYIKYFGKQYYNVAEFCGPREIPIPKRLCVMTYDYVTAKMIIKEIDEGPFYWIQMDPMGCLIINVFESRHQLTSRVRRPFGKGEIGPLSWKQLFDLAQTQASIYNRKLFQNNEGPPPPQTLENIGMAVNHPLDHNCDICNGTDGLYAIFDMPSYTSWYRGDSDYQPTLKDFRILMLNPAICPWAISKSDWCSYNGPSDPESHAIHEALLCLPRFRLPWRLSEPSPRQLSGRLLSLKIDLQTRLWHTDN